jgi:hypothetical protein
MHTGAHAVSDDDIDALVRFARGLMEAGCKG